MYKEYMVNNMSKKIGVVTITKGTNYGNKLQNYAIVHLLKKQGCDVFTIQDVTEKGFANPVDTVPIRNKLNINYIKKAIEARLQYKYHKKNDSDGMIKCIIQTKKLGRIYRKVEEERKNNFLKFSMDYLNYSKLKLSATQKIDNEEIETFDAFICGSDQVWNPIYQDVSKIRFLTFAKKNKRIALAPSFGVAEIPESREKVYAEWLKGIESLSVREESGAKIIKKLIGCDVPVLIDPTLMLKAEEWDQIAKKPDGFNKNDYLLTYFLGNKTKIYEKEIRKLAYENNLEIVDLSEISKFEFYSYGPAEFLWLIKHANYICTDSFHGTVFSILYKKNFITFPRAESGFEKDNRVMTLLKKINLEEAMWKGTKKELNYLQVDQLLEIERNKFNDYLQKSLANAYRQTRENKTFSSVEYLNKEYKTHCNGCGGCMCVCPMGAIEMEDDEEGFLYPKVNEKKCIKCKKCLQFCIQNHKQERKQSFYFPTAYAAMNKDENIRRKSSSGGVFYLLAEYIIDLDGVVFGAALDNKQHLKHIYVDKINDIKNLMGSKYIQSDLGESFEKVAQFVSEQRYVLFTGTPCQCAALKKYIGDSKYLIIVDFICHGVPSQLAFDTYLKDIYRDKEIKEISFRDKTKGWERFSMKIEGEGKVYNKDLYHDEYLRAFLNNVDLRYSCYECRYKEINHCSDWTIGDLWGASSLEISNENRGISIILIQNKKGEELLEKLGEKMMVTKVDGKKAISMNSATLNSVLIPDEREMFYKMIKQNGFIKTVNKIYPITIKKRIAFLKEDIYKIIHR